MTPFFEPAPAPPHLILPIEFANGLHGNSSGAEITADVRATPWWRVTANYSYLRLALSEKAGSSDLIAEAMNEGGSPRHQWQIRSSFGLMRGWSADWFFRYASRLQSGPVPGYATSTVRVAWQPIPRLELAIVGANLHHDHHLEWATGGVEVPRSGYASATASW
jgi:iron complex outermembrane receptor protein